MIYPLSGIVIETVTVTEKGRTEIEIEIVVEIDQGRTVVAAAVVGAITCLWAVVSLTFLLNDVLFLLHKVDIAPL